MVRTTGNSGAADEDKAEKRLTAAVSVPSAGVSIERPGLYVVATPIGNLDDISARALAVLDGVDRVLCEDTRRSRQLLAHFGISTPLTALHDHNEKQQAALMSAQLRERGEAWALISDAGTPLISDPGYALLRAATAGGVRVVPVPGPSALTAALSVAGLPTDRFIFEGFLPAQAGARQRRLEALVNELRTVILFEAPHRIEKLLTTIVAVLGAEREIVIARELTKHFETLYRGTAGVLLARLPNDANLARGELVVMIAGSSEAPADESGFDHLIDVLLAETDHNTALRIARALSGKPRNEVYRALLARRQQ